MSQMTLTVACRATHTSTRVRCIEGNGHFRVHVMLGMTANLPATLTRSTRYGSLKVSGVDRADPQGPVPS